VAIRVVTGAVETGGHAKTATAVGRTGNATNDRPTTIDRALAPPDHACHRLFGPVMSPRVAFVTAPAAYLGSNDTDRPIHEAAARAVGLDLIHQVWSDPDVRWEEYDLVVVRSTWDYLEHLDAFLAWLRRMDRLGTLQNPGQVILWNLDKRYLLELAEAGVPVIATRVCATVGEVTDALAALSGEVVVKPVVSAGSNLTGRFASGDPAASELAAQILSTGKAAMIQPAVASVATHGEVGTLVFAGRISHAVRKGPLLALGGGMVGGTYAELVTPEVLTDSRRTTVDAAVRVVERLVVDRFGVTEPLLYARIDTVTLDDGTDVVLEVELAEPSFFLETSPGAADRFAAEVQRRASAAFG
jgi:hypothetical protein